MIFYKNVRNGSDEVGPVDAIYSAAIRSTADKQ